MAFRQAWENFIGVVAGFVASLGILIPLGALVFVAWLGVRRRVVPALRQLARPEPTSATGASGD